MSDQVSKQPSEEHPTPEEKTALNLLINTLLGSLSLSSSKERRISVLSAVIMIARSSWDEMMLCYEQAVKLSTKREVKVADIQSLLNSGDEA